MSTLAQRAEVLKLARVLGAPPSQFEYLHKLDAEVIRRLREQASAALFDADRKLFQRVAATTKLLPAPLIAIIAEKAIGPLLCARTTGLLPPERAVEISKRLKTGFLADLCLELDPRSASDVIAAMPVDRVVEVSRELARRKEYITMARFVDCLDDHAIRATMEDLRDDEALLRIGFFVEDKQRLSDILDLLPRERLLNIVRVAAGGDAELWPEALAMINCIEEPQRRQMASLAAELEESAIIRMIESTQAQELWPAMLPVVSLMNGDSQRRLINLPALQNEAVLGAIIRAADSAGLWAQLLPLVALMDNAGQARAARVAESQGPQMVARLNESLRALAKPAAHA
ncbi:MAG: hypothetical protein ACHQIO_07895 [Nevskiales bacterium]